MVQQASLNTTFMFVGIIVAFLLYNVYILFQVYDFFLLSTMSIRSV